MKGISRTLKGEKKIPRERTREGLIGGFFVIQKPTQGQTKPGLLTLQGIKKVWKKTRLVGRGGKFLR